MPHEVTSEDEIKALLKDALEVRVVKREDAAKLKVRTKKGLYSFKTTGKNVDVLVKGLKVPIAEF